MACEGSLASLPNTRAHYLLGTLSVPGDAVRFWPPVLQIGLHLVTYNKIFTKHLKVVVTNHSAAVWNMVISCKACLT